MAGAAMAGMAAGAARLDSRSATQRHFAGFWQRSPQTHMEALTHEQAIGLAVVNLADTLERDLSKPGVLESYIAAMADFTPEQCIQAFSRALDECRFFPRPSELRALASPGSVLGIGAQLDREAAEALSAVVQAMRKHGPKLKAIPGRVVRERDGDGCVLLNPEREAETPAPVFDSVTEGAIRVLGMGEREAGLAIVAEHPARMGYGTNDPERGQWVAKNTRDLEQRWNAAWRGVYGEQHVDLSPADLA